MSDPLSRQTLLLTDPLSRVTRNLDPAAKATDYEYDGEGNLTKVTDALGGVTLYGYAPGRERRRLAGVTDAKNQTTSFGYDAQDRLTSVANALNQTRTSQYDAKGNLTRTINARGQAISYAYDALDRLKTKTTPEGAVSYQYDAAGNLTKVTSYNGSIVELSYDALNRVTQSKQTFPGGYAATIGYGYDANGNRTSMTTPWGSFSYEYDALNRLTKITNPQSKVFTFGYDAAGRRTRLTYPNGVETSYAYDAAGQVTQIIHRRTADNTVLAFNEYVYDAAGNRTVMEDLSGAHNYGYDDLHRLTAADHPAAAPLADETFTYDAVGNRLADAQISGYTYDAANRLLENSSYTYTYDADGNQLSAGATSFAYTSENALLSVMMPNAREVRYEYDAFGRRIVKSTGTATARVVTQYAYDGDEVLALIDYAAVVLGVITNGPGTDEPLMIREIGGIEWYMHADALGSIVALTAPDGTLRERIEYGAFGETRYVNIHNGGTVSSQSISRNRAAFTARENDSEYGRYYYRERQTYDPVTGRFGQEDPIGFRGGLNFYTYVGGSPTNYADPTGECPWCVAAGVGAAVGAGLDLAEQIINNGAGCIDWSSVGMSAALGAGLSGLGPTGWAIGRGGARAAKYGYNATAPWLNRGGFRFGWSQTNKSDVLSLRIGKVHHDLIPQKFGVASGARPGRDGAMAGLTAAGARDSGGNCGCKKQ